MLVPIVKTNLPLTRRARHVPPLWSQHIRDVTAPVRPLHRRSDAPTRPGASPLVQYALRGKPRTRPQRAQFGDGHTVASGEVFRLLVVSRCSLAGQTSPMLTGGCTLLFARMCGDHSVHSRGVLSALWGDSRISPGAPGAPAIARRGQYSRLPGPKPHAVTSPSSKCNCQLPGDDGFASGG